MTPSLTPSMASQAVIAAAVAAASLHGGRAFAAAFISYRSPEFLRQELGPVDRGRSRYDSVVILRIPLRLH